MQVSPKLVKNSIIAIIMALMVYKGGIHLDQPTLAAILLAVISDNPAEAIAKAITNKKEA